MEFPSLNWIFDYLKNNNKRNVCRNWRSCEILIRWWRWWADWATVRWRVSHGRRRAFRPTRNGHWPSSPNFSRLRPTFPTTEEPCKNVRDSPFLSCNQFIFFPPSFTCYCMIMKQDVKDWYYYCQETQTLDVFDQPRPKKKCKVDDSYGFICLFERRSCT